MIDTLRPVSLPEGVEITLRLAGPVARARAWLIDFGLRTVVMMFLPSVLSLLGDAGTGLMMIAWFAISTLYPILFEALWDGATPGKRICNLAVVHADGTPVGRSCATPCASPMRCRSAMPSASPPCSTIGSSAAWAISPPEPW